MRIIRSLVLCITVLAVALAAAEEKKVFTAAVDKDGVQRVNVVAGSYFFDPNYIIVKVNVPVELMVKKEPGAPHDLVIEAPEAGIKVKESLGSDPKKISFTPTKTGKYPFYCDKKFFKSHREKGMEGTLEVIE